MPRIAWQLALDSDGEASEAAEAFSVEAAGDTPETAMAALQSAEPSEKVAGVRFRNHLKAARMREAKAQKRARVVEDAQMTVVHDVVLCIRTHSGQSQTSCGCRKSGQDRSLGQESVKDQ